MGTVEFASRSTEPGLLLIFLVGGAISFAVAESRGILPGAIAAVAAIVAMIAYIYSRAGI